MSKSIVNRVSRKLTSTRDIHTVDVPASTYRARSHTGVIDYDEACFMHLNPGMVHNFPKAVGV